MPIYNLSLTDDQNAAVDEFLRDNTDNFRAGWEGPGPDRRTTGELIQLFFAYYYNRERRAWRQNKAARAVMKDPSGDL